MARERLLDYGGLDNEAKAGLARHFEVYEWPGEEGKEAFLAKIGPSISGAAAGGDVGLPNAVIDRLPGLRIIASLGVGYDRIDTSHAISRGIMVTHTPDVLNDDVANLAIAHMLAATRRVVRFDRFVREGRWAGGEYRPLTHGIAGKTVGMVGLGRIGREIVRKLAVFGCDIVYHTRNPRQDVALRHYPDLVVMAGDCDILFVALPGGEATTGLVDRHVIEALGPEGTLISIGRGSAVNEPELVKALADGRLGAAGLDVFSNEPNVPPELFSMDNVVLTPHLGSATVETRKAMAGLAVDNLVSFLEHGKAITPVPECRHLQA